MPFDIIYHCLNAGVNFFNNRIDRNLKYNTHLRHELNIIRYYLFLRWLLLNNIGTRRKDVGIGTHSITCV